MSILDDLVAAESTGGQKYAPTRGCAACQALESVEDPATKEVLKRALAGTIGTERLSTILAGHGYTVSRRQINNHRAESRPEQ